MPALQSTMDCVCENYIGYYANQSGNGSDSECLYCYDIHNGCMNDTCYCLNEMDCLSNDQDTSTLSTGAVVGIIAALIVVLICCAVIAYACCGLELNCDSLFF